MKMIWESMNEEIGRLKEWDETTRKAEEVAKWLEENMEIKMKEISELEREMEEKEKEMDEIWQKIKDKSMNAEKKLDLKMRLLAIGRELAKLKDRRDEIKWEYDGKYESYHGVSNEDLAKK